MALYKGHRVRVAHATLTPYPAEGDLVHLVVDDAYTMNLHMARMACGVITAEALAVKGITDTCVSCVWCATGLRRYNNAYA